jgi:hypothetical protein
MSQLPTVEARKVTVGSLLWWPDCNLLWRWGRSTVELLFFLLLLRLLLLELPWLELWVIAPSAAVVVDAADPQVEYTPCGTWEEHR